jgi:D-tyrosyl-tRNA(Tyr) deacylase
MSLPRHYEPLPTALVWHAYIRLVTGPNKEPCLCTQSHYKYTGHANSSAACFGCLCHWYNFVVILFSVNEKVVGAIQKGVCLLIGIHRQDTLEDAAALVKKVLKLRLWPTDRPWQANLNSIGGEILAVSQFTLYAVTDKGAKPCFYDAMGTEEARIMFDKIVEMLRESSGLKVETGAFGELMNVEICNDGPVTLILESKLNFDKNPDKL